MRPRLRHAPRRGADTAGRADGNEGIGLPERRGDRREVLGGSRRTRPRRAGSPRRRGADTGRFAHPDARLRGATGARQPPMPVKPMVRSTLFMQNIEVPCRQRDRAGPGTGETPESPECGIGRRTRRVGTPLRGEGVHPRLVAGEAIGCRHLGHVAVRPDAVPVTKRTERAFGRDAGTGANDAGHARGPARLTNDGRARTVAAMALTRAQNPMPDDIAVRLDGAGLRAAYEARPPYQRNDYLGWIARAKRPETREKRLVQMFEELVDGRRYMRMRWGGDEGATKT